jgi:hypothetical protein
MNSTTTELRAAMNRSWMKSMYCSDSLNAVAAVDHSSTAAIAWMYALFCPLISSRQLSHISPLINTHPFIREILIL